MQTDTAIPKQVSGAATSEVLPAKQRLVSIPNACIYTSTSRAKLYTEYKAGYLKFIKLDGATRVEISELDRWIDAKSGQSEAA